MGLLFSRHPGWPSALKVIQILRKSGYEALIAGGSVRDALLGRTPKDFDVATSARPDDIERLFSRTEPVGKAFGVMMVVTERGPLEVATFRRDGQYLDGRRPERVDFSSSEEDAKRRDFTMNALFYDPLGDQVIDHVGGIEDIRARRIRAVGEPHARFAEDKLRMVRAVRFVSQLGFSIEQRTWEAIKALASDVKVISRERRGQEMERLLMGSRPDLGVWGLWLSDLDKVLMPEFHLTMENWRIKMRTSLFLRYAAQMDLSSAARWATLFWSQRQHLSEVEKVLKGFCFSQAQVRSVLGLIVDAVHLSEEKDIISGAQLLGKSLGPEVFTMSYRQGNRAVRARLDQVLEQYVRLMSDQGDLPQSLVTGQDLIAWGVPQGAGMGTLLKECYREQLRHDWQSKEEVRAWVNQKCPGRET